MNKVLMYATPYCPYCIMARRLLQEKNVPYDEIDVSGQPQLRREMTEKAGRRTVPQIFIGGRPVGGYDELFALESTGRLDQLLTEGD